LTDPLTILFSRASPATFVNSNGLIEFVGVNVPRYEHDPTTLAPKCLLIEASAMNLAQRTHDLRAWSRIGVTTLSTESDTVVFPILVAGKPTFLVMASGTFSPKHIRRAFTPTPNMATASVYLRRGTNNFTQIFFAGDTT
jgi:hypothetical protein